MSESKAIYEISHNPVLTEVKTLLESQTAKGLEKYGNTVDPDEYTAEEWIDHALQEMVDMMVYLVTLKTKLKEVKDHGRINS
ncbi:hypothetical protein [Pseudobacillus badius]|uniref:hypothetical protein n=1 Tax=Bacillus badius TaxID=1455 RepID=UPI0007BB6DD8|nr:hypothetical protein [Bacillus badius]KZR60410.1 hypothetical protein A3781_09570 [Bacillus badius]